MSLQNGNSGHYPEGSMDPFQGQQQQQGPTNGVYPTPPRASLVPAGEGGLAPGAGSGLQYAANTARQERMVSLGSTSTDEEVEAARSGRSTRGASKQRRDLINNEISNLRDLLPLPESARQRLSQLQIMSLSCCYIRKCNYFTRMFGNGGAFASETPFQFSQAMNGFLLITTREGKLLYISENITEYLGHSMVDMMTQGDSLYDIIDKRDHATVQAQLLQTSGYGSPTSSTSPAVQGQIVQASASATGQPGVQEERTFFCRMNVARSFRRQAGFGDHKMMHVRGHFIQPMLRDHYGNQPVFMAICSPLVTPDMKETAVQNNTMIYQSVHGLDLKFIEIGHVGEHHLGYSETEMFGKSLYELLHPEDVHEAKEKHMQLIKSSHEMGCMLTVRLQNKTGTWVWINMVMHIRQPFVCDNGEPAIICINHVIQESEAQHFKLQSQLYSSHIAPSPEYLAQGASPPHTITQVSVERDQYPMPSTTFMGALQSQSLDEPGAYFGEIGVTVTSAEGLGSGGMSGNGNGVEGIHLQHSHSQGSSIGSCSDAEANGNQMERRPTGTTASHQTPKQMQRADILNKLKRKMTEHAMQQCKPAKSPRLSSSPDHQSGGNLPSAIGPISYSAQVLASPSMYGLGGSAMSMGDVQVMGPIQHNQVYADLALKNEIKVEDPRPLVPVVNSHDLAQPLTPPTPYSMASESSSDMMTSLSVEVDTSDAAIVPPSILTPESSPASSPTETVSPNGIQELSSTLGPNELNMMDELSFFDNLDTEKDEKPPKETLIKEESPTSEQQRGLPVLDVLSLEDYLSAMESPKPLHPQLVQSPPPALPLLDAIKVQKLLQPTIQDQHVRRAAEQLLGFSDDQFLKFAKEAIRGANVAADQEVRGSFMLVPSNQNQQVLELSPASVGSSSSGSDVVEMYNMGGQMVSPSDGDILDELHQLSEELVNSPSYGDEELASSLFNQTL